MSLVILLGYPLAVGLQPAVAATVSSQPMEATHARLMADSQQEQLARRYDAILAQSEAISNQLAGTEKALAQIQSEVGAATSLLRKQAVDFYVEGGSARTGNALFERGGSYDTIVRQEYFDTVTGKEQGTVHRLGRARSMLKAEKDALEREQGIARANLAQAARAQGELAAMSGQPTSAIASGASCPPPSSTPALIWPIHGPVAQEFGHNGHPGIDIDDPNGTPIHASGNGVVVWAGWQGGYGNFVLIDHGDGISTGYGHQSRIAVTQGQTVPQGQIIGFEGSTGASTGPHVHFELRVNNAPTNPRLCVPGNP